jgi:hypothetical protein
MKRLLAVVIGAGLAWEVSKFPGGGDRAAVGEAIFFLPFLLFVAWWWWLDPKDDGRRGRP